MGLNIKNPKVEADVRLLAAAKGVSLTEAIALAVRNELREVQAPAIERRARLEKFFDALDQSDSVSVEGGSNHDFLYGDDGLPK